MKTSPMNYHCECGSIMMMVFSDGIHAIVRCLATGCPRRGERRGVLLAEANEVPSAPEEVDLPETPPP